MNEIDFEKNEELLKTKQFHQLNDEEKQQVLATMAETEYIAMNELYAHMRSHRSELVDPPASVKSALDKVLAAKKAKSNIFRFPIPAYQVAAMAIFFFLIGFIMNYSKKTPERIVRNKVEIIKYIVKPVTQIRYIKVPAKSARNNRSLSSGNHQTFVNNEPETKTETTAINPLIIRQQEIVSANIERALNESNGSSMDGDSVFQKMLVTVY